MNNIHYLCNGYIVSISSEAAMLKASTPEKYGIFHTGAWFFQIIGLIDKKAVYDNGYSGS